MPPLPKPAAERRNRSKKTGARVLYQVNPGDVDAPSLPERSWHPLVVSWWSDIWSSPMAPEWQASDVHGLFELAGLMHRYWLAVDDPDTSPASLAALAGQLRQGRQQYGLSPLDRRRLEWEIDRGSQAAERTATRAKTQRPKIVKDPRVANAAKQGSPSRSRSAS